MDNDCFDQITGIILGMGTANESHRYNVTLSLIGCAHPQSYPCIIRDQNGNNLLLLPIFELITLQHAIIYNN